MKLIFAVPVGPEKVPEEVLKNFDEVFCLHPLKNLSGVGLWYEDFDQVEDQTVLDVLHKSTTPGLPGDFTNGD